MQLAGCFRLRPKTDKWTRSQTWRAPFDACVKLGLFAAAPGQQLRRISEVSTMPTWRKAQYYVAACVNRRVRRTVPHPDIIAPRLDQLFADFSNIRDATTEQPLFTAAT